MTPKQFIESRRVEGGLMGGVFVDRVEAAKVESEIQLRRYVKQVLAPALSAHTLGFIENGHGLHEAFCSLVSQCEDHNMLYGDGTPGFDGFLNGPLRPQPVACRTASFGGVWHGWYSNNVGFVMHPADYEHAKFSVPNGIYFSPRFGEDAELFARRVGRLDRYSVPK